MKDTCPSCGDDFKNLPSHWVGEKCDHPQFTEEQHRIVAGLMMGDGSISTSDLPSRNPRLRVDITQRRYLEFLNGTFGLLSTGHIGVGRTAEESAQRNTSFKTSDDPDDWDDCYYWQTIRTPRLSQYADWYEDGDKYYPTDIELTPTSLKHWFVNDGTYHTEHGNRYISIGCSNEYNHGNQKSIEKIFSDVGFKSTNWKVSTREDGSTNASIVFDVETTSRMFDYMGDPLPGFEYKWPNGLK